MPRPSAFITCPGGSLLPYYLDEEHNWALDMADLKSQVDAARAEGKSVRPSHDMQQNLCHGYTLQTCCAAYGR